MPSPTLPRFARNTSKENGQSLVEFTLALPFLLLVLFGAIDLSRAFQAYIVVTNSAREGARYGSTHPNDNPGIESHALAEATGSGVTIAVSAPECFRFSDDAPISCASAYNGDKLKVQTSTTFQFATLYIFRLSNMPISYSTTMAITTGGLQPP